MHHSIIEYGLPVIEFGSEGPYPICAIEYGPGSMIYWGPFSIYGPPHKLDPGPYSMGVHILYVP